MIAVAAVRLAATTLLALIIGSYAVAVIDVCVGRMVARLPIQLTEAFRQPVRTFALLLAQRRTTTERPDAVLWAAAPVSLLAMAAGALAVIPFGLGTEADVSSGIVYFGALMAMVMVAVFIHGWSANSVFPLIGGYRFIAEALSYEMPLALVLIAAALPAQSLSVDQIVRSQDTLWNVVRQPLGLPIYLVSCLGLAFWGPLALPDAADVTGGTVTESSGVALLLWRAAQKAILVAVAAMGAATFLGAGNGPWLPAAIWLSLKTLVIIALLITAGHTFARWRLERFVVDSWVVLIPLALVDVFVSGALALANH